VLELRRTLVGQVKFGLSLDCDADSEVLVTASAGRAILAAFSGLLDLCDEVIVHNPDFVSYVHAILIAHARPIGMPMLDKRSCVPSSGCDVTYHERITRDVSESPSSRA
jgi:aspartate/methionine/tyrosine aminotransferase